MGATMPADGGKSVAADLRARFPAAAWLSGTSLHHAHSAVRFTWRCVDDSTWLSSLQARPPAAHPPPPTRTLPFASPQMLCGADGLLGAALHAFDGFHIRMRLDL